MLGDIISSAASIWNAEKNREASYEAQSRSQEFSERMANTQYQRMVADLNAAGLSPMLAYGSAKPSSPSGSPMASSPSIEAPQFGASALRKAQAQLNEAQVDVAESQEQVNVQTAKKVAEEARLTAQMADNYSTQFLYDMAVKGSQINANSANATNSLASARNTSALANLTELGKAPSSDPTVTRITKDVANAAADAKSAIENFIGNTYRKFRGKQ